MDRQVWIWRYRNHLPVLICAWSSSIQLINRNTLSYHKIIVAFLVLLACFSRGQGYTHAHIAFNEYCSSKCRDIFLHK